MKVYLDKDEWYPVLTIFDVEPYEDSPYIQLEVDDELVKRYNDACVELKMCQKAIIDSVGGWNNIYKKD